MLLTVKVQHRAPAAHLYADPISVRGTSQILKLKPLLEDLCVECDQAACLGDLNLFFSLPDARNKTPHLILFASRSGHTVNTLGVGDLVAAVLTYEHRFWKFPAGIGKAVDGLGRRTVIAPAKMRSAVASLATRCLMDRGAEISWLSYQAHTAADRFHPETFTKTGHTYLWASQRRELPGHLPLRSNLAMTLEALGPHTRARMQDCRELAVQKMGCVFVPQVRITESEFLDCNRMCDGSVPEEIARLRYRALSNDSALFMGVRDRNGNWLSLAGGHRSYDTTEIYWQLNLDSHRSYSLGTVLHSWLIEHEILCGTKKLKLAGEILHLMGTVFTREFTTDLVVRRVPGYASNAVTRTPKLLRRHHTLSQLLSREDLSWQFHSARSGMGLNPLPLELVIKEELGPKPPTSVQDHAKFTESTSKLSRKAL